ncbi:MULTISPECIES: IclR family transcriptional regulator [unclassified Isoptericola]|uniref:IclR family transcriptional regulator n=1 Tax=unclassified Isoptericola TaxID=2623355 RepID=UPI0027137C59|nr:MULTISPECIES: IclR family transcriptional regulator [unclassified Isoptericola]MDO8143397.1 IclR family transcriptional regulator [Isoptericola sp. 178]MDO8147260.1 IclR family transcriptional regulator [Isoptericola sp. b515]MDO8150427.1 IclR family transcriptional regulator [Isoptericola sp. b408]
MAGSSDVPAARATARLLAHLAAQPGPVPASSVAASLDLPRSSVYHLLSVLADEGFVTHYPEERRYGLGVATLGLGTAYTRQAPVTRLARPVVSRLVEATGENGHLALLNGREVLYLVEQRAPGRPPLVSDVDVRLPAHLTASGRAVLAHLPAAQVRAAYPTTGAFSDRTGRGPRTLSELRTVLREVRRRGYAVEDGEVTDGFASVADVVVDHLDRPVAGLALTFRSADRGPEDRERLADQVSRAAAAISTRLGARPR